MGMFDYVNVKIPLPDGETGLTGFQTKDFENNMATHELREDGLWYDPSPVFGDKLPLEHRPNFTGEFRFYTYRGNDVKKWYEYQAIFVGGTLVSFKRIDS